MVTQGRARMDPPLPAPSRALGYDSRMRVSPCRVVTLLASLVFAASAACSSTSSDATQPDTGVLHGPDGSSVAPKEDGSVHHGSLDGGGARDSGASHDAGTRPISDAGNGDEDATTGCFFQIPDAATSPWAAIGPDGALTYKTLP